MMEIIGTPFKKNICTIALGAESAGVFAVYCNGNLFISENFGDLLDENNFLKYKKAVLAYLKKRKAKPQTILTDLHPLFKTTIFGGELAEKYGIPHIKVQHHIAHIFSSVGDFILNTKYEIPNIFLGIAADGTGYGLDGNIWGGEVFQIKNVKIKTKNDKVKRQISKTQNIEISRIGSLEEQIMIGGDLAVREPARMIIAILAKIRITDQNSKIIKAKEDIYDFVKRYYARNEFELLYNQLKQGFNCQKTTSTGRILDAVSVLLGFAGNTRNYKHEAMKKLEYNSTIPYHDCDLRFKTDDSRIILNTTHLFEYLIKNIERDKKRLAATAQLHIAKGFYEIVKKNIQYPIFNIQPVFAAGGMANNKIISEYLENYGLYISKKIPRGDEGIAFGQIIYYLFGITK